jgi:hypothetical protein
VGLLFLWHEQIGVFLSLDLKSLDTEISKNNKITNFLIENIHFSRFFSQFLSFFAILSGHLTIEARVEKF